MWRYSPASSSRVQAEPRSSSSAHCTSSSTSTSPRRGAISTVQQRIGARVVDPLLPGDQPDVLLAERSPKPAVRLLREHPQRACVDAAPLLREELERVVRLARVRRAEVRDDASPARRAARAAGSRSRCSAALHRRAATPSLARAWRCGAARPLRAAASVSRCASRHGRRSRRGAARRTGRARPPPRQGSAPNRRCRTPRLRRLRP